MADDARFEAVYRAYSGLLVRVISARIGSGQDADDLAQDVFLAYCRRMDEIPEDAVKTWLLLAANRRCIDYFRRKRVRGSISCTEQEAADNVEQMLRRMNCRELLFRILETLQRDHRIWYETFQAGILKGVPPEEAARALHVSPEAVRGRVFRARRFLAREYGDEYREL